MTFRPLYKKRDWMPSMMELYNMDEDGGIMEKLYNNPRSIQQLEKENLLGNMTLQEIIMNPGAIDILEKYINEIDGYGISLNPAAGHLFRKFSERHAYETYLYSVDYREEQNIYDGYTPRVYHNGDAYNKWENTVDLYGVALNPQGIDYIESNVNIHKTRDINLICNLCWNPRAIHLLEIIEKRDRNLLDFSVLVNNPNAVHIVERNLDKLTKKSQWNELSFNENAVHIMRDHMSKIHWPSMSQNPSDDAIQLLMENIDKIDWPLLHANHNPKAMELLKKHPDKINYFYLSDNPVGIDILEEYVMKNGRDISNFDVAGLATNTSMFILDTHAMKEQINKRIGDTSFVQELMEKTWHPKRVQRYVDKYNYDILSDSYIDVESNYLLCCIV